MAVMQCLIYTWRGRGWAKAEMISFQRARPGRFRFQRVVMLRLRYKVTTFARAGKMGEEEAGRAPSCARYLIQGKDKSGKEVRGGNE